LRFEAELAGGFSLLLALEVIKDRLDDDDAGTAIANEV
jgi:hypothetical protein